MDSSDEAEVRYAAEDSDKYKTGLFFPVSIGDYVLDKYHIVHKLGHGSCSTVWLAHDTLMKRDVALKVMIPGDLAEHEFKIQNEIKQKSNNTSRILVVLSSPM